MKATRTAVPAFFPPGWPEKTVNDPKLAEAEIIYLSVRLREIGTENREVREERDDLKRKLTHETKRLDTLLRDQSFTKERESLRVRENKSECKQLGTELEGLKRLRTHLKSQLKDAEFSLEREAARSQRLEYIGRKTAGSTT